MLSFIDRHTEFFEYVTAWMFVGGMLVFLSAVFIINAEKFYLEEEPGWVTSVATWIHTSTGTLTHIEERIVNYTADAARISIFVGIGGMVAHYFRKRTVRKRTIPIE